MNIEQTNILYLLRAFLSVPEIKKKVGKHASDIKHSEICNDSPSIEYHRKRDI